MTFLVMQIGYIMKEESLIKLTSIYWKNKMKSNYRIFFFKEPPPDQWFREIYENVKNWK